MGGSNILEIFRAIILRKTFTMRSIFGSARVTSILEQAKQWIILLERLLGSLLARTSHREVRPEEGTRDLELALRPIDRTAGQGLGA